MCYGIGFELVAYQVFSEIIGWVKIFIWPENNNPSMKNKEGLLIHTVGMS